MARRPGGPGPKPKPPKGKPKGKAPQLFPPLVKLDPSQVIDLRGLSKEEQRKLIVGNSAKTARRKAQAAAERRRTEIGKREGLKPYYDGQYLDRRTGKKG